MFMLSHESMETCINYLWSCRGRGTAVAVCACVCVCKYTDQHISPLEWWSAWESM